MYLKDLFNCDQPVRAVGIMEELLGKEHNPETFYWLLKSYPEDIQKRWLDICLLWVLKCRSYKLKEEGDLRIKVIAETGNSIFEILRDEIIPLAIEHNYDGALPNSYPYPSISYEVVFVETICILRRYKQQLFSRIAFNVLSNVYEDVLHKELGVDFWNVYKD